MTIEKICEYFNDIGLIQLENINRFLQIYSQLSQNKYKNKSDKLILALFSYITLISKNEQQLYDLCKNIVNTFSNNQILNRYKALNMFHNITKYKLQSRYILFFSKLNSFIYNKKRKIKYIHLNPKTKLINSNSNIILKNDISNNDNDNNYIINTSVDKNNERKNPRIRHKIIKIQNRKNNIKNANNISDDDKECTFSPKINHYKPNYLLKVNNIDNYSSYNNSNDIIDNNNNDNSFSNKNIPFKNSINYGYNNKINNEIEKMLLNMTKYNNAQNNSKYIPKKATFRKQINNIYPPNSYNQLPNYENNNYNFNYNDNDLSNNNNNIVYHYYDENYDFYENEKEHVKKVQDKILQLKLEKMDKMSKECTFSPEINKTPNYLIYNNNNLSENINDHRNYYNNNYINNNYMYNSLPNNIKNKNKKNKINEEYRDDYYNVYPPNLKKNKKQRPRSYSDSKNNNGYSIYKNRKEELNKLFKEQYPFTPNIKFNKNIKIASTFEQRQKKFIEDKENIYKQKEKEELKQIEEFKKNHRSKTDSKEVVKRLYNDMLPKIQERIKKEKEEKSKKKNVIDWSKKRKNYNKKYPNDFKNNKIKKNKNSNINNEKENKFIDFEAFSRDKSREKQKEDNIDFAHFSRDNKNNNNNKNKNEYINGDINNNKFFMDKIKDEHIIGFKNNNQAIIKLGNKLNTEGEDEKEKESINNHVRTIDSNNNNLGTVSSIDFEEKMKNYEENNILNNLNKNGIKSTTFQEMMKKHNNK